MKKLLLLPIFLLSFIPLFSNPIATWKTYLSFEEIQDIQPAGKLIYVLASNNLYSYNVNDNSLQTYDKTNVLSDHHIQRIAYSSQAKRLMIVYENYNIDLLDDHGNVTNLPNYFIKSLTEDKRINSITIDGNYAYLATTFGFLTINIKDATVVNTYHLNKDVWGVVSYNNYMIATTPQGTFRGDKNDNLLDKNNWKKITDAYFDNLFKIKNIIIGVNYKRALKLNPNTGRIDQFFNVYFDHVTCTGDRIVCTGEENTYIIDSPTEFFSLESKHKIMCYDAVNQCYWRNNENNELQSFQLNDKKEITHLSSGVKPDGPINNNFEYLLFKNNTLYTCGGGYYIISDKGNPGTIKTYSDGVWTRYEDYQPRTTDEEYIDNMCLDVDPNDPSHVFTGGRTGLYEFKDGKIIKYHNMMNSPLSSALNPPTNKYTHIFGIKFDPSGNLWVLNSSVKGKSLFRLDKEGVWKSYHKQELSSINGKSLENLQGAILDSKDQIWLTNNHWNTPALFNYNIEKDSLRSYTEFTNQDGERINILGVRCVQEDLEHNIWVGTNVGPLLITAENVSKNDNATFVQVKVPRDDGTNLADYLLSNVDISCIAVDGANRKWFGTSGNGVYLISSNNLEQIHHFTADNSNLLSNDIRSVAINNDTGEVFFGTSEGLCSFTSDATAAKEEMDKDNVYAYPNPVEPNYNGPVTILGLSYNADIKIVTVNGALVAQGRSNGGTFVWNGNDMNGKRVASGIYMVLTATEDGKKGVACKIAVIN